MASDDVIELGSSDEEKEPAPKKRKPPVNAMVHIPNHQLNIPKKLPEVTIIASKSNKKINPAFIAKGSIGKSVTVTKVPKTSVNTNTRKFNGKPLKPQVPGHRFVQIPIQSSTVPGPSPGFVPGSTAPISGINILRPLTIIKQHPVHKTGINPLNKAGLKTYSRANYVDKNASCKDIMKMIEPSIISRTVKVIKGPNSGARPILPPGITVKRTAVSSNKTSSAKRSKQTPTPAKTKKPGSLPVNEVLTVDDDDEPSTSSASGRQWYLRPEEGETSQQNSKKLQDTLQGEAENEEPPQTDETEKSPAKDEEHLLNKEPVKSPVSLEPSTLEQQNNKEPDKSTFIEITIDDSPIKPPETKKGFKVGAELSIIIEDSPVKNTADKTAPSSNSDDEAAVSPQEPKERSSKKKLEYPKNIEMLETVEIEFEPFPVEKPSNTEDNSEKPKRVVQCIEVVEIEESPVKPVETTHSTTPKKNKPISRPAYKEKEIETVDLDDQEKEEFHPIYQSFVNLCFQLENSEDMNKIVEKKIKAYYRQVPKEYTNSENFIDMVSSKIMAMKASPEKMYLYIKDIVDELNLQRKMTKAKPPAEVARIEEQNKFLYGEDSEFDAKRQRQIRKLEKTLKKLHRAIQKLEEQEVDFDDEEDSVYLLTESEDETLPKEEKALSKEVLLQRYKERMVRVHAKLCQLTNTKMPSEARVHIDARPGQPKGPAKRLEKWINRKVPIGKHLPFPDFHDVVRCVRDANQEDKLGWNEGDVMSEARDLFTRCGKKLQRRRQENEWRLAASRIPAEEVDPAEDSTALKRKLEENRREASKRETEVFNKYADRQNQLNLEPVEIGDKEAEESPVESDDEDPADNTVSLISKEKRKERIKRLLKEKSKRVRVSEKENKPDSSPEKGEKSQNENKVKELTESDKSTTHIDKLEDQNSLKSELPPKSPLNTDLHDTDKKGAAESHSRNKDEDDTEEHSDKVHSLSDDSSKVESDVDELHLLSKLRSKNGHNTSVSDSSDSGTPVAISTSSNNELSSDEQHNKKETCDVISIENSSYSESEENKSSTSKEITDTKFIPLKITIQESIDEMEIECSNDGIEKKINNKIDSPKYSLSLEDILLASSDDADDTEKPKDIRINLVNETCVNLRDDTISIGETVIGPSQTHGQVSVEETIADSSDKNTNTDASSVEGMEIGPTEIYSEKQNGLEDVVDTMSVKSTDDGSVTEITSIKSPEIDDEEQAETTSIKSVETIEDECAYDTKSVKSVESVEDGNVHDTESIKSVEAIKRDIIKETVVKSSTNDDNDVTTSVKPIDTTGDNNVKDTANVKSVETVGDKRIKEIIAVESVDTTVDKEIKNIASNKSVETVNDKSIKEVIAVESVDTTVDKEIQNIASVKSVETVDDTSIKEMIAVESVDTTVDKNMKETAAVESVDTTVVKEIKDTPSIKPIETNDDDKVKETGSVKLVETADLDKSIEIVHNRNKNETSCVKSVENIDNAAVIVSCRDSSRNEKVVYMDTTESTESAETSKDNRVSIPEAMDVDSNVEQEIGI